MPFIKSKGDERKMSNIRPTLYLDELIFENECNVDFLFREEQFCLQLSAPDGRIIQREFVPLIFKKQSQ